VYFAIESSAISNILLCLVGIHWSVQHRTSLESNDGAYSRIFRRFGQSYARKYHCISSPETRYLSGLKVPSVSIKSKLRQFGGCKPKLLKATYRCTRLCLLRLPCPTFLSWSIYSRAWVMHSWKLRPRQNKQWLDCVE